MDNPFDQSGSVVLSVCPPKLLHTPSLLAERAESGKEEVLTLCELCSTTTTQHWCVINAFSQKSKTQHYTGCYVES